MEKYVSQWYWDTDWQGKKYKVFYHGPRLKWMKLFKDESIEFEEINIEEIDMSREELYDLAGKYTVPQIFINEKCIGGYDQLLFLYQNKELHSLVNGK